MQLFLFSILKNNKNYLFIFGCLFLGGFDQLMPGYEKKDSRYLPKEYLRGIFNLVGSLIKKDQSANALFFILRGIIKITVSVKRINNSGFGKTATLCCYIIKFIFVQTFG